MANLTLASTNHEAVSLLLKEAEQNVRELSFSNHKIDVETLKELCEKVGKNKYVETLELNNCDIDDDGANLIAEMIKKDYFRSFYINLENNKISGKGFSDLILTAEYNWNLLRFNFIGNQINEQDLKNLDSISDSCGLNYLYLSFSEDQINPLYAKKIVGELSQCKRNLLLCIGGCTINKNGRYRFSHFFKEIQKNYDNGAGEIFEKSQKIKENISDKGSQPQYLFNDKVSEKIKDGDDKHEKINEKRKCFCAIM